MDLVVDHVAELQHVHDPDHDRVVEGLAGAAVDQGGLAVVADQAGSVLRLGVEVAEDVLDRRLVAGQFLLVPLGAVEHRGADERGRCRERPGLGLGAAHRGLTGDALGDVDVPTPPCGVAEV